MHEPDLASEDQWPLVHLDVSDLAPAEGARVVADVLTEASGRHEAFAAVVQMPSTTERPRGIGGVSERIRMLKQLRPRLKETCRGLAFVVSAETQATNAKAIRAGAKMWGCPTFATDDVAAATAWAQAQLAGASAEGDA
ncbi:hypothetical protein LUW76_15340 [Actinomadura madurae]|uniref:hypothetical protein n=1 Tax=Actinomadura madurae TaxID=1993 RepID=UPI002026C7BF|nr:hypothetical protein [Actinomadura madurae]URM95590.1 hypothetical protein LUW76_15340 [Actinomadura madurae]URN06288.1 hypothetical protein LUW74_25200 [Actinomadura madurae]